MKIAATYDNGNIFQHFGKTEFFKVYEVEDNKVISSEVISSNGTGHGALAGLLAEQGISVLICGGIGGGAAGGLRVGEGAASGYPDPGRTFLLRFFKTACFCGGAAIGSYGTSGTAQCAGKEHYADHCCGRG